MIFEQIYDSENLRKAWDRVPRKSPAGIDRVTCDMFTKNLSTHLHTLQRQLKEGTYQPMPVVVFDKNKKKHSTRLIGISTVRDKVVQQAVLQVIGPVFDRMFLPCTFAYRPGKSALAAVKNAGQCIEKGNLWVLQMDVANFFDSMDHGLLTDLLRRVVDEKPFLRLLSRLLKAKIFKEMGLFDTVAGTQQGSGLSPLLSNIYLHPLDMFMWQRFRENYIRYSDDITVFADEREKLEEMRELLVQGLTEMKLRENSEKTTIRHVSSGIVYLGYCMDTKGRGPDKKSVEHLQNRLRNFDRVRKTDDVADKKKEIRRIIRGWYNYYHTLRPVEPPNILSLLVLAELADECKDSSLSRDLLKKSPQFRHNHPDIAFQLGEMFTSHGMQHQAMREYARTLEISPEDERAKGKVRSMQENEGDIHEAIKKTQLLLHHNPHYLEGYQKLIRYYNELGLFGFAEKAHEKALEIDAESAGHLSGEKDSVFMPDLSAAFDYRRIDAELFLSVFKGRAGIHAKQWVDERGKWGFNRVDRPMKKKDVMSHLQGETTLGVYPVNAEDHVHFIVFDVDTAKRRILESDAGDLENFRKKSHEDILRIKNACQETGIRMYTEDSGYKGRHGWVFFTRPCAASAALRLGQEIMKKAGGPSEGMIWELFPMGKSDRHNSIIKLPLGINRKNKRRCLFLSDAGEPIMDQGLFLKTLTYNDLEKIKGFSADENPAEENTEKLFPDLSAGLQKMVQKCKFVNLLIRKVRETHYLNHYERMCLLYTLSFAGEEGTRFLHRVIAYCINYSQDITQKHIDRRKSSPISCAKIGEYFPDLAKSLPCNCRFTLPPGSYPSPVLYLLAAELEQAVSNPFDYSAEQETVPEIPEKEPTEEEIPAPEKSAEPRLLDFDLLFHSCGEGKAESKKDPGEKLFSETLPVPKADVRTEAENRLPDRDEKTAAQAPEHMINGSLLKEAKEEKAKIPSDAAPGRKQAAASPENNPPPLPKIPENRKGESSLPVWEHALKLMKLTANRRRLEDEIAFEQKKMKQFFSNRKTDEIRTSFGSIRRRKNKKGETEISVNINF